MKNILFFATDSFSHIRVCINRPQALNAINFEVMDELDEIIGIVENHPVYVFELFTSDFGYLASGGDLKAFSALKTEEEGLAMAKRMATLLHRIEQLSCITIISLNGKAYGGGGELALAFDLLYTTPNALLGFTQARFNVTPGWNGTARLVQRIGTNRALDVLLNKRELKGDEIFQHGIATKHMHSVAEIDKEISRLVQLDRNTILSIKRAVKLFDNSLSFESQKEKELELFAQTWASESHHTAVELFLNKHHKKHLP